MFYEESQIDEILKCRECNQKFDEPRILPCGSSVCTVCLGKISKTLEKATHYDSFKCSVCQANHKILKDAEFPVNYHIQGLLQKFPVDIYRGDIIEKFKSNLKFIETGVRKMENDLKNSIDKVKEHFIEVRCDIDLATEAAIEQIKHHGNELIELANDYEKKTIASISSIDLKCKMEFEEQILQMHEFSSKNRDYLVKALISDNEVLERNKVALELKKNVDFQQRKLEALIFNKQKICFESNKKAIVMSCLGNIKLRCLDECYDLNEFEKIDLSKNLSDIKDNLIEIHPQDGGSLHVFYQIASMKLRQLQVNNNSILNLKESYFVFDRFKKYMNIFAGSYKKDIYLYTDKTIVDVAPNITKSTQHEICLLSVNNDFFFCIGDKKLHIYNMKLELVKSIGQQTDPTAAFFLPPNIKQFESKNEKYFCLTDSHLLILKESDGKFLNSFEVKTNIFTFDSKGDIVFFNKDTKELNRFSIEGDLFTNTHIHIENYHENIVFMALSGENKPVFFDQTKKVLMIYK